MSSSDSKLLLYAKQEANQAITFENAGKFHQAINKYERAAEILIQFLRFNKNPIMRQNVQKSAEDYISRAKILRLKVSGKSTRRGTASTGTFGSAADKSEAKEEGVSEEEQELLDMISGTIVTESPNVRWIEIAGLENCKQSLREAIVLPMIKPELFTGARKPWAGILLFGPPGCGKTLLAKAAATECNATFFSASSADLLSKWLGESEKLIGALFKVARLKAPSLIFMDEIDSIATKRGEGTESGGERRVKTQLLSEIQGLKTSHDKPLLVLGATNRPWDLDNAMLSRFEKKVYVPLPDLPARAAIFKIHTAGIESSLDDEDFIELGARTEGYSGRDIANVCREVIMLPIRELDMGGLLEKSDQEIKVRNINLNDFKNSIKKVKPMTTDSALKQYDDWKEEFGE
ncbi:MAG: AAA family ATPase [Promethearchaeota archaeon]|nr:MAG: AAA family ATPase [Candidatus Lokiarchaeota archaeon]